MISKPLKICKSNCLWGDLLSHEYKLSILLLASSLLAGMAIAADEMGEYNVNLSTSETLGTYLVNETGFSLYYFTNDSPGNGSSTCYGKCMEAWPLFYAENITVPESLNASEFTEAIRTDGEEQTAYRGWPLYYYYKDTKPGDVLGQGVNDAWFVINATDFWPTIA
jgi:predicted lipoprotein with Yx(FWY)xxD motif